MICRITMMAGLTLAGACLAQEGVALKPAWAIEEGLQLPESAYYDPGTKRIYISNVATAPDARDGKGYISVATLDGKLEAVHWVKGLNAPKGMRSHHGTLWVSCVDELVGIDLAKAAVVKRVKVDGAKFLNDVAVDAAGTVYVSDMMTSKIHAYDGTSVSLFAEGDDLEYPNGLVVDGERLIVASWGKPEADFSTKTPGRLYSLDLKTKKKTLITEKPTGNLDGVELDGKGGFIVTDWIAGKVFAISKEGMVRTLLQGFRGSADHAYLPDRHLLILPRMGENIVAAYDLSKLP